MGDMKGIAIRLDKKLYDRIESQKIPRNSLIQEAISRFLDNVEGDNLEEDIISDDTYSEVYSTLYNSEMLPLKQKNQYQEEIITLLKEQLNEIRKDKQFLQNHLQTLMESNTSLLTRIKKKIARSSD